MDERLLDYLADFIVTFGIMDIFLFVHHHLFLPGFLKM